MATANPDTISRRPGESCGVFGAYGEGSDVSRMAYFGLFALQHRGQESAGIAVSDGDTITVYKDMGLVDQVFNESTLAGLQGHVAVGHTRYSTTGSAVWENSQPTYRSVGSNAVALAHNGNLTNTAQLSADLGPTGTSSDSELLAEAIAEHMLTEGISLPDALAAVLPRHEGAFSLTVLDREHLIGVRDPRGFRPLCLGRTSGAWVIASESAALSIIGAEFVREIEPGEMVIVDRDGLRSAHPFEPVEERLCLFEFVYFSRPDSVLHGQTVHSARTRAEALLAERGAVEADVVVPVPESGIPAAQGFAARSGIAYADGLVKNRYVGRTFIQPTQAMRDDRIRMKLSPIPSAIEGKRVVVVDDSIIRGSTTLQLVQMVRSAGASEVHLRIASPPYRWPCWYGMDTGDRSTLIAADRSTAEVAAFLEVDSLVHLDLDGLLESIEAPDAGFCSACLTGDYPTEVPPKDGKLILEGASWAHT